jgi:predicted MPP superfamily phosphohydrolase
MRHGILQLALIMIAISLLMDFYVYQGLKALMPRLNKTIRRVVLGGYLFISVGIVILLLIGLTSSSKPPGMTTYHQWILSIFLTLLITKVFFILVLFAGDVYRLVAGLINALRKTPADGQRYIPTRRRFVSEAAVLIAAIPFTSFFYAMLKGKYDYRVHKHTLYFDDLPEAFDGFTITHISDVHSGSFDNPAAVQRGIDLVKAQKSDLFVFTGDLVNNVSSEIKPYINHFNQLKAPYGQFSILGNHDYGDYVEWNSEAEKAANLEQLKGHHKTLGYKLLLDENVRLEKGGQKIVLIGVQNWGRGFIQIGDLNRAMQGVAPDEFKILLSHDPTHWEEKVRYHPSLIHLTLAGHTHGAQFGVETDKLRWSPVKYRYLDWAGLLIENKRHLYVNRGFGFLAFSGRLGIWPEITVLKLKRGVSPQPSPKERA